MCYFCERVGGVGSRAVIIKKAGEKSRVGLNTKFGHGCPRPSRVESVVSYMHILASPAGVHALPSASASESTMTSTPKATQAYAGIVVRRSRELVSLRKHAAGKMNASAVADTPPVISSVTPRSHVTSDTVGRQIR